jgi:DNA-binding PadR family transcriptional regulator
MYMSPDDILDIYIFRCEGRVMEANIEVQTYLPLTEVTYFILLSISPGRKHGYAIMKDVEQLSEGRVMLSTGTLYGAIKRLLDLGWIERADDPQPTNNNRERKVYALTDLGARVLKAEIARLNALVVAAQVRSLGESG